jgi:hypothetical protein
VCHKSKRSWRGQTKQPRTVRSQPSSKEFELKPVSSNRERGERIRGLNAKANTHLPGKWRWLQNFLSFGIFRFFRQSNCRIKAHRLDVSGVFPNPICFRVFRTTIGETFRKLRKLSRAERRLSTGLRRSKTPHSGTVRRVKPVRKPALLWLRRQPRSVFGRSSSYFQIETSDPMLLPGIALNVPGTRNLLLCSFWKGFFESQLDAI